MLAHLKTSLLMILTYWIQRKEIDLMSHKKVSPWSLCLKHDDRDHPPRIGKEPFHLVWKVILTRKIFSCFLRTWTRRSDRHQLNPRKPLNFWESRLRQIWQTKKSEIIKGKQKKTSSKCTLCVPSTCLASRHWPAPCKPIDGTKSYPQSMCSSQSDQRQAGASSREPPW